MCIDGVCEGVACSGLYDPVCGADGRTYGNACLAMLADVRVLYEGECRTVEPAECETDRDCPRFTQCTDGVCEAMGCPMIYDPVCGVDGRTYGNACEARAARVAIAYAGECEDDPPTRCRRDDDCDDDQFCDATTNTCTSRCVIACLRPDPVCGTDGRTYICGAAEAECNGAEVAYRGACRLAP
jgi:hypothetical protein